MTSKLLIPASEKETLEQIFLNHSKSYYRNRAQTILLRSEGFKVETLALMYKTRKHTVYEWIRRYKSQGFLGLKIVAGRGIKSKMNDLYSSQIGLIYAEIKRNPQSLRGVCTLLSEKFGFEITKSMPSVFKKNLNTLGIDFENVSNLIATANRQDPVEYARLAEELETLLKLEDQGYLKVYFADESGRFAAAILFRPNSPLWLATLWSIYRYCTSKK